MQALTLHIPHRHPTPPAKRTPPPLELVDLRPRAVRNLVPGQYSTSPVTEADLDRYLAAFDRLERTPGEYAKIAWRSLYDSFRQRVRLSGVRCG